MGWWRTKKLLIHTAKKLLISERCKNMKNYIRDMEDNAQQVQEIEDTYQQCLAQDCLAEGHSIFKTFPAIQEWQEQYSVRLRADGSETRMPGRFKFLVLKGPSRMGKTQLASSLYGRCRTFLTGCQNAKEPNLVGYQRTLHDCIVYDEAGPAMVVSNKVLFQASTDHAVLCQSQCQQHTKKYYLFRVPMIICTNKWVGDHGVNLDAEDQEWLEANSVVVEINKPCWFE